MNYYLPRNKLFNFYFIYLTLSFFALIVLEAKKAITTSNALMANM